MAKPNEITKTKLTELNHSNDCYTGLAVSGRDEGEFILIAKDSDTLRKFWDRLMIIEINEAQIRPVAVVGIKRG